jgi:hypothetical protein
MEQGRGDLRPGTPIRWRGCGSKVADPSFILRLFQSAGAWSVSKCTTMFCRHPKPRRSNAPVLFRTVHPGPMQTLQSDRTRYAEEEMHRRLRCYLVPPPKNCPFSVSTPEPHPDRVARIGFAQEPETFYARYSLLTVRQAWLEAERGFYDTSAAIKWVPLNGQDSSWLGACAKQQFEGRLMANSCTRFLVEMQPLITRLDALENEPQTPQLQAQIEGLQKEIQALFIDYGACMKVRPEPFPPPPR